jgi:phage virion morphogenesis protein
MAGAFITIDLSGFVKPQQLLARLSDFDKHELLESCGVLVESQTQRRIREEKTDPDGTPWAPWSAAYAKSRHPHQSLLLAEGYLLASITHDMDGDDAVLIHPGSNLKYARALQMGDHQVINVRGRPVKRNLPARRYLGLSSRNMDELGLLVKDFFSDLIDG